MANVEFYKGQSANLSSATKADDAFYYTEDKKELYTSDGTGFYRIGGIPVVEVVADGENFTLTGNYPAELVDGDILYLKSDCSDNVGLYSIVINDLSLGFVTPDHDSDLIGFSNGYLLVRYCANEQSLYCIDAAGYLSKHKSSQQSLYSPLKVGSADLNSQNTRNVFLISSTEDLPTSASNGDLCFRYE